MRHRKRCAFIQCTTNTPSHFLSIKCISIKLKVLFLTEPTTLGDNITSRNSNCQVKKSSNNNEDNLRCPQCKVLAHPFFLIPCQLTAHPKLPFEVVDSLKACKLNNNSQSCPKLLCLYDINDGGDDGDQKKSLIRRSPTATSF